MSTFLRVFAYCRRYPFLASATLACAIVSTLMLIYFPKLSGMIVGEVRAGRSELLAPMTLLLAAIFLIRDGFNCLRINLNNSFEQKVIFDLRSELYECMQKLPIRWFDERATGDLMTRVSDDVTSMERVIVDGIEQGVVAILQIAGVGIMMFWINPSLASWALLPIAFKLTGAWWYTTTAHARYRLMRKATSAMNALLLDNLQGIRQIKTYVRENRQLQHFRQKAMDVCNATLNVMRAWSLYNPAMSFFSATGVVLVLYFGGKLALQPGSDFHVEDLVTMLLFVQIFYDPINRLHQLNQLIQSGRAAAERVFQIMDTPTEDLYEGPGALPPTPATKRAVSFLNASLSYRDGLPVLHEINLEAAPGQTIALVGPTGAGKTSLVNLIPRFYQATGGTVAIDGIPVDQIPLVELRAQIGVVTQESFLFNGTVKENLLFGKPNATEAEMRHALEAANAWPFVDALPEQLETNVGERGVKLSVGEKQRIAIARALLKDPPILILDEATASVDTATEALIQQAFNRLLQKRTSFVIAHRLSTVRNADLICVMEKGRIIERGNHDSLLAINGLYARLCKAQSPHATIEETFEDILSKQDG